MRQPTGALFGRIAWFIRADEWWSYKIPLALGVAYALAWRLNVPFRTLEKPLLLLIAAGITSAIYASIFNDLMDREEDIVAGKVTGMMRLPPNARAIVLIANLLSMFGVAVALSHYHYALTCYLTIWTIYTLYSLPPIRLKARGIWGVLCIAFGEHLLAGLLAAALIVETSRRTAPIPWLIAMIIWSVALGCRSILWHQLCDYENDRKTGTNTLGAKYAPDALRRLGEWYIFPVEAASFAALLALSRGELAWALLAGYIILEWLRCRYFACHVIIVAPKPNFRFALLEYYQLFFPFSFLLAAAQRDSSVYVLAAVQLALFPFPAWLCLSHVTHLIRWRAWPFIAHQLRRIKRKLIPRRSAS